PLLRSFLFAAPPASGSATLSLHAALPIWLGCVPHVRHRLGRGGGPGDRLGVRRLVQPGGGRRGPLRHLVEHLLVGAQPRLELVKSEEHTSELQSLRHLVCRLLLEKKKKNT